MRETLLFANQAVQEGSFYCPTESEMHHIRRVLRLRPGNLVLLRDPEGVTWRSSLADPEAGEGLYVLESVEAETELGSGRPAAPVLHLWQALPKAAKMDEIVRKATELSVSQIHPVVLKRCISRPDSASARKKTERWRGIAEAASRQAGRLHRPGVSDIRTWEETIRDLAEALRVRDSASNAPIGILPYEGERGLSLRDFLFGSSVGLDGSGKAGDGVNFAFDGALRSGGAGLVVHVLIGAEGGIAPEEAAALRELGLRSVHLGRDILRCETAGPAVLAMLKLALPGGM